jgi:hypothetical protein
MGGEEPRAVAVGGAAARTAAGGGVDRRGGQAGGPMEIEKPVRGGKAGSGWVGG